MRITIADPCDLPSADELSRKEQHTLCRVLAIALEQDVAVLTPRGDLTIYPCCDRKFVVKRDMIEGGQLRLGCLSGKRASMGIKLTLGKDPLPNLVLSADTALVWMGNDGVAPLWAGAQAQPLEQTQAALLQGAHLLKGDFAVFPCDPYNLSSGSGDDSGADSGEPWIDSSDDSLWGSGSGSEGDGGGTADAVAPPAAGPVGALPAAAAKDRGPPVRPTTAGAGEVTASCVGVDPQEGAVRAEAANTRSLVDCMFAPALGVQAGAGQRPAMAAAVSARGVVAAAPPPVTAIAGAPRCGIIGQRALRMKGLSKKPLL